MPGIGLGNTGPKIMGPGGGGGGGGGSVNITWDAPAAGGPAFDGYRIYKSTDGGSSFALLDTAGSGDTSATVAAVAGDQLYVAAYNDAGESIRDGDEAIAKGQVLTIV